MPVEYQVAILYAAVHECLSEIPVESLRAYEGGLYRYLDTHAPDVLNNIRTTGTLTDGDANLLEEAIRAYNVAFLGGEIEA